MGVGRYHAEVRVVAEDSQGGIAIAGAYISEDLIVGAILTNDDENVLDLGWSADLFRDCEWLGVLGASGSRVDILRQIPVVVGEHLLRQSRQGRGGRIRQGDDAHGAKVLVGVEVVHAMVGRVGIFRRIHWRRSDREACGPDALIVRHQQLIIRSVKRY